MRMAKHRTRTGDRPPFAVWDCLRVPGETLPDIYLEGMSKLNEALERLVRHAWCFGFPLVPDGGMRQSVLIVSVAERVRASERRRGYGRGRSLCGIFAT